MDAASTSPPDWDRLAEWTDRFQSEVETNWSKYFDDVKVLANADQDSTSSINMCLRIACTFQRSRGAADPKSHGSEGRPGRQALAAFYSAAAVAADQFLASHRLPRPSAPIHKARSISRRRRLVWAIGAIVFGE